MTNFDSNLLTVTYLPPATPFHPVEGRKYTLTHSDTTGELYLSIGIRYDMKAVNPQFRDEVVAEWTPKMGQYILNGTVYVSGGEFDEKYAKIRYMIFKRELDLALTAMVYGDRSFYLHYPWLLDSPIFIQFSSVYPQFNQLLYFGTPRKYLMIEMQSKKQTVT
ncbi:staygreen family protein [Cytobacillus spongiae]|uniref:staygreen family protein n=1 Tax=Cytobacillus spongiae TaxID=2901381 RepID=UPI001F4579D2|nr:staygreen family protein [Cytobacillus spongiae]UII54147.1 staygreen family protein [Cytobacillus spongiae]